MKLDTKQCTQVNMLWVAQGLRPWHGRYSAKSSNCDEPLSITRDSSRRGCPHIGHWRSCWHLSSCPYRLVGLLILDEAMCIIRFAPCGRYFSTHLTWNKEGSNRFVVLRPGSTPIRFQASILFTSLDKTNCCILFKARGVHVGWML